MVVPVANRAEENERGAVSIQIALFLPILVIILIGGVEVWKVLYVQQVLNDAAYQGVRLLCMQPNHDPATRYPGSTLPPIPAQVEALVERYVASNPFVSAFCNTQPGGLSAALSVRLSPAYVPDRWEFWAPGCGQTMAVVVSLTWYVGRGWTQGPTDWSQDPDVQGPWLPFLNTYGVLTGRAEGVVLCEEQV